ncbi:MAG TPA: prepilin peptidase [Gemmatimonadaceae bacterium]|nr:prepilin peptidase [Gemmatimonadaceae bacterium]
MRALALVYAALVGACVGSFLNVCITRWPEKLSVVRPRSRCPRCEQGIAWYDNIPVISWLVLRGKCRNCGLPISPLYPAVELTTALIWLASVYWLGTTFLALRVAIFATLLLGVAVTDLRTYTIPDGFTVTGLLFLLAASFVGLFTGMQYPFVSPFGAILGACTGAGAIAIVGWLGEVALKKEAMGFGDVTLMAFIGAAIGPELSLLTVFVGAALGAFAFLALVLPVAKARGREVPQVPFGVFLAPAALVTLLYGRRLIDLYLAYLAGA